MFKHLCSFSIRIFIHGVVTFPFFDTFIMVIIIMSSIALAAEDPVRETSERNHILTYFDYVFTGIFAVEMILKVCTMNKLVQTYLHIGDNSRVCNTYIPYQVIDLGVIAHPGSYLRDIWNLMDALVVICASISFLFDMM